MPSQSANPSRPELTQEQVRRLFDYEDSGNLIWKVKPSKGIRIGAVAGTKDSTVDDYKKVKISGYDYSLHRVIYLWHHGDCPPLVDHENRNKKDNRIENLRPGSISQNAWNVPLSDRGKIPHKGITYRPEKKKPWICELRAGGKRVVHTSCSTLEEARAIIKEARRVYHGKYACFD